MAVTKWYLENSRANNNTGALIRSIKELMIIITGITKHSLEVTKAERYWLIGWIDLIAIHLQEWNIIIKNIFYNAAIIIKNKTIIDYAIDYASTRKQWKERVGKINKVRLYKKLLLPFELVGIDRGLVTNIYLNNEE